MSYKTCPDWPDLMEIAPEFTRRQMEPRPARGPARLTPAEPFSDPHDGT